MLIRFIVLGLGLFGLCACTTLINPPAATEKSMRVRKGNVNSVIQYADTRSDTHFGHRRPTGKEEYVKGSFISCPSPMPDTATQFALAAKASGSSQVEQSANSSRSRNNSLTEGENSAQRSSERSNSASNSGSVEGSGEVTFNTTVVQLDGRTQLVLAARDVFHNLCIMYANGSIKRSEVGNKFDATLELMTSLAEAEASAAKAKQTEAEAKKDEATAKKTEAEAKKTVADATKITAEIELRKLKAAQAIQARTTLAQSIYFDFVDGAGNFDTSEWNNFVNGSDVADLLDSISLRVLKSFPLTRDEIVKGLSTTRFETYLSRLKQLSGG